jgi:simple sugar transport system permease protein
MDQLQRSRAGRLIRSIGRSNEAIIAVVIVALVLLVGLVDGRFWAVGTAFNVAHDTLETLVFALAFLVVLLIGGIDVSFDAVGIFAGYTVSLLALRGVFGGDIWLAFALAGAIGLGLGAINGLAVVGLRLPVLIATLATRSIYVGILLSFIGSRWFDFLPGDLGSFADIQLMRVPMGLASVGLTPLVLPVIVLCVVLWYVLSRTMFGKGLYAVGGDPESARRAGFPMTRLRIGALCLAGLLAGLGGMTHVTLIANANPYELVGSELKAIAAVVLGGASIFGGRGTVLGTALGAILIALINYSMVLLGIPTAWTQVVVGVFLLLGISAQLLRNRPLAARRFVAAGAVSGPAPST